MNDTVYDEIAVEKRVKDNFGLRLEIESLIAHQIPTSHTSQATVFMTTNKLLYVYLTAKSSMTLGDVRKVVTHMSLQPEGFLPPKNQPDYFDAIGIEHVRKIFPGRTHISEDDVRYYRTLAPYNPALILIREIKNGEIKQFDTDAHGNWRVAVRLTYRRMSTS